MHFDCNQIIRPDAGSQICFVKKVTYLFLNPARIFIPRSADEMYFRFQNSAQLPVKTMSYLRLNIQSINI
jgi:hypothetical protein